MVFNRQSGTGSAEAEDVVAAMREAGAEIVSVDAPERPTEITDLARRAAADAEVLVIGGGDGTISHTLPVFVETGRTLGVLPMGTANDLARSLGIPLDPVEAARVIATGAIRSIDLGEINGRPFCNAVSIGFPVDVAAYHHRDWKRFLGVFAYPVAWMRAAWSFRPFDVTVRTDEGEFRLKSMFTLTVMNGRYHGGGLAVDEQSAIDDGVLKVYGIEAVSGWRLLRSFATLKLGKLKRDRHTIMFRARHVEITGGRTRRINVDGDLAGRTPAEIRVMPGVVRAVVPVSERG